jgi:hypothetical protein
LTGVHRNRLSIPPPLDANYSTAQTLWHTTTPIDLNFVITNLPTGQLAEGTITSYNTNGTHKTATLATNDTQIQIINQPMHGGFVGMLGFALFYPTDRSICIFPVTTIDCRSPEYATLLDSRQRLLF